MKEFVLADPDVPSRLLVREILNQLDEEITLVPLGNKVSILRYISIERTSPPLLLLLDPLVRFTDPVALIREIKDQPQFHKVPIILWTQFPNDYFSRLLQLHEVSGAFIKSNRPSESKLVIRQMLAIGSTMT